MKIAIQGHPFRGKEVIQILENLGGKNVEKLSGTFKSFYYINSENEITDEHEEYFSSSYKLYTLEEFEKEFPFKVGDIVQTKPYGEPAEVVRLYPNPACVIAYKVRYKSGVEMQHCPENLKFYKEMKEERNITLTLDKAKEWYQKGGELKEIALQAFTEKELNPLPRSWDELCRKYEFSCLSTRYSNFPLKYDALFKLEQLRDCWRQGWEPECHSTSYAIKRCNDEINIIQAYSVSAFLSFPTKEMAEDFLACFRDLIEKAGDLI